MLQFYYVQFKQPREKRSEIPLLSFPKVMSSVKVALSCVNLAQVTT